jgi:ATP:cob(I)alamin adenosyltransferase
VTGAIYTRRGDAGQTRLLSGEVVDKDDARVQTYGAVDELQAHIGLAVALTRNEPVGTRLRELQEDMVIVAGELASSGDDGGRLPRRIGREDAARLERWLDELTASHPLPQRFVRPGASPDSAAAHVARAVSRRCERLIVALHRQTEGLDDLIVYFNRLSDFLFVAAWCLEAEAGSSAATRPPASPPPPSTAATGRLTLPIGRLLADVVEREAAALGVPVTIAVVDADGGLVYLARMDGALPASRDLAVAKASTAAGLRMATEEVGGLAQPGGPLYGIQHVHPGTIVLFGGGVPLRLAGSVFGGIGISGGTVEQDVQLAASAVEALAQMERWSAAVRSAPTAPTRRSVAQTAGISGRSGDETALILTGAIVLGLAGSNGAVQS